MSVNIDKVTLPIEMYRGEMYGLGAWTWDNFNFKFANEGEGTKPDGYASSATYKKSVVNPANVNESYAEYLSVSTSGLVTATKTTLGLNDDDVALT